MIEVRLKWLSGAENIRTELKQSSEEGKNKSAFKERAEEILKIPYGNHEREKMPNYI